MKLAIVEPYYGGSHKYWADNLMSNLSDCLDVDLFTMPARHWKWRMQGSAFNLAQQVLESGCIYDVFLVSSMIDLAMFKSLIAENHHLSSAEFVLYNHENQLCYPVSQLDKQAQLDLSYGYLNIKSCICADRVVFNSLYHLKVFLEATKILIDKMPDFRPYDYIENLKKKSSVLPIGIFSINKQDELLFKNIQEPIILWNHRWDHDKNPELFYKLLHEIKRNDLNFKLVLTQQLKADYSSYNKICAEFNDDILYNGYKDQYKEYCQLVASCDILPVPRGHDFFGISVLEAVSAGLSPILPDNSVYEEHFDSELYSEIYYSTDSEFMEKVINKLKEREKDSSQNLSQIPLKYNWNIISEQYKAFLFCNK